MGFLFCFFEFISFRPNGIIISKLSYSCVILKKLNWFTHLFMDWIMNFSIIIYPEDFSCNVHYNIYIWLCCSRSFSVICILSPFAKPSQQPALWIIEEVALLLLFIFYQQSLYFFDIKQYSVFLFLVYIFKQHSIQRVLICLVVLISKFQGSRP